MAVQLLRLPNEPADWANGVAVATGGTADAKACMLPDWPASKRFALVAVIRGDGPPGGAHTRAVLVTTAEDMDRLLTNHTCHILWFTVARHHVTDDMIERTLGEKESIV